MRGVEEEGPVFSSDQKLVDKVMEWEQKAAEQYKEDGLSEGWESDNSEPETAEQRYIRVRHLTALPQALICLICGLPNLGK